MVLGSVGVVLVLRSDETEKERREMLSLQRSNSDCHMHAQPWPSPSLRLPSWVAGHAIGRPRSVGGAFFWAIPPCGTPLNKSVRPLSRAPQLNITVNV